MKQKEITILIDRIILTCLILLASTHNICGENGQDSLTLGKYIIYFPTLENSQRSHFAYEEGVEVSFLSKDDLGIISFWNGSLLFIAPDNDYTIISSKRIDNLIEDRRYKYQENNTIYYERVIRIIPYSLYIVYEHVKQDCITKYERILENICISERM